MIPAPDPRRRGFILAALMMTMTLAAVDTTIVATAIPQIVTDLGGFAIFGWVLSIYLLAQTVTIPVYGKLADTLGRKPVLMTGTSVFLAGSLASAFAWSMPSLILFRGLQGLGAGAIMATVYTLVGDLYSTRERAAVEGWLSSVWGVTAIVGPTVGGAFAEYLSWRWIFLVNLPIGIAALALLGRFLVEDTERRAHRVDYLGAALLLLTGAVVVFWLLEAGQGFAWISLESGALALFALVLALLTVARERRAEEPILPGWLWRRREHLFPNLATMAMGLVMMGPNTYLPTYGQAVLGLGAISAGLVLASMSIGWPLASSWSGRVYLRVGFRNTALLGATLILAALGGFLLLPPSPPAWLVVADQVLIGAGFGLVSTPLLVGIQGTVTHAERGVVTGANVFSRNLGNSLGAALAGAMFNGAVSRRLADAPRELVGAIPTSVDAVLRAFDGHAPSGASSAGVAYLRATIHAATHEVYAGLLVVALALFAFVLAAPRRFPVAAEPVARDDAREARPA